MVSDASCHSAGGRGHLAVLHTEREGASFLKEITGNKAQALNSKISYASSILGLQMQLSSFINVTRKQGDP